ncbi:hypothetical protein HPG69_012897 [Diceros bicornis minor]|uniref:Uncharacterized protein n=1 Tax=Diceros bicornis minor TaxID=77932 RepID=A0A7J7F214_DICBM|nr:hypothetical protein HPG69_012897 [Diceros bicornis minor]
MTPAGGGQQAAGAQLGSCVAGKRRQVHHHSQKKDSYPEDCSLAVSEVTLSLDSNTYLGTLCSTMSQSSKLLPPFILTLPQLPTTGRVGQLLICTCIFKHTLHIPLTNAKLCVESLGISPLQTFDQA